MMLEEKYGPCLPLLKRCTGGWNQGGPVEGRTVASWEPLMMVVGEDALGWRRG